MQRDALLINENDMEVFDHANTDYPCTVFIADVAKYLHSKVPWHWHEEIELFIVTKGKLKMLVGNDVHIISESNGALVNTNILHSMEVAEGDHCELITLVFSPSIFTGGKDTVLYEEVTSPIYKKPGLAAVILSNAIPWERETLSLIRFASKSYVNDSFEKNLLMCENLAHIWRLILRHSIDRSMNDVSFHPIQNHRTQIMMKFIQDHYQNPLTVQEIAKSAGISTRECTRCFKHTILLSPIEYLMQYRISESVPLLLTTNDSMTKIATTVGFNSSSYYSKVFKSIMNVSPSHYKKLHPYKNNRI